MRLAVLLGVAALVTSAPAPFGSHGSAPASASPLTTLSSVQPATRASRCWRPRSSELGFARKINIARKAAGDRTLRFDAELSRVARYHTWQMAHKDRLFHTPDDNLRKRVTNWMILGENVGVGHSVDTLHQAFMFSPAHKENILLPAFTHVGVGASQRGDRMWVTVLFESSTNPGTHMRMPRC
jgi:uncharacterized protein YkwD